MKKLLLVLSFVTFGALNSYGFGIGVEGGYGGDWGTGNVGNYHNGNIGLSLGFGDVVDPSGFLGVRFNFQDNGWGIGAHYDVPFVHIGLTNWLYFFVAGGVGFNFGMDSDSRTQAGVTYKSSSWRMGIVGRLPIGLRFILIDFIEIFIELDPNIGLGISHWGYKVSGAGNSINDGNTSLGLIGGIGGSLGIRFWF